jgi:hypothetical protein
MKIEKIFQTKYLFINGNFGDKNKKIIEFLEFYHNKKYFSDHKINLLMANRDSNNKYIDIIEGINFENQGVIRIINSTDELFHKILKLAYAIIINSENEGLDLNLMKAIKLRKPIYINPDHTFLKNRLINQNILNELNIHKINSNDPKYNFEASQTNDQTEKYHDFFTKSGVPRSVSIKKLINEIMEIKS